MVKRVALLAVAVTVLVCGQVLPAAADTGFTLNDFKVTHAVADISPTATVTVDGWIDRDLQASQPLFNVHPSFDVQQPCQNLVNPTDTIVATRTLNWPFAQFQSTVVLPAGQHGNYLKWTISVSYDPALDHNMSPNGICPSGGTLETTYVPLGWTIDCDRGLECHKAPPTVASMRLAVWPGRFLGISPLLTKKGELLWVTLAFPSGHTEY